MQVQYRQGDILLVRTDLTALPEGMAAVEVDDGRVILAYGEATGHAHALSCDYAKLYRWEDQPDGSSRLLHVLYETELKHEEHAPIRLEPGMYEVIRQREYHPEELRNVND